MDSERAITLFVSFTLILLSAGVFVTRSNPAVAYELSIYQSTPATLWAAVLLSFLVVPTTVFFSTTYKNRIAGVFLGVITMLSVIALPIIRGYHYTGAGDAMSYLGRGIDIQQGNTVITESLYPGIMVNSVFIDALSNIGIANAFMLIPAIFAIVFITLIPVLLRSVEGSWLVVGIGFLSSLLILPVNQISRAGVFLQPYPTLAALFYLPISLFTIVLLYTGERNRGLVLFLITSISLLMIHPQQAANLLVFIMFPLFLSPLVLRISSVEFEWEYLLTPSAVFTIIFWIWAANRARFEQSVAGLISSILVDTETTGDVESAAGSLEAIGGSIIELFFKIFFIGSVYALLTMIISIKLLVAVLWWKKNNWSPKKTTFVFCLSAGLIPVGVLFIAYIIFSSQYFRHLGFLMVIGTILGSLYIKGIYKKTNKPWNRQILTVIFLIFLILSLPLVHMSPYIYQSNPHVTSKQMTGYETTFEVSGDTELITVRDSPRRFSHALYGRETKSPPAVKSPDGFANQGLSSEYNQSMLLILTTKAEQRETELYNGFRFSSEDFEYIKNSNNSKVYDNSGYMIYYISD